jgi:acetyl esterase/lipase
LISVVILEATAMDIPGPGPIAGDRTPSADIRFATSVKPSDVSTSTVVDVSIDPQIALGRTPITMQSDIVYAVRQALDGSERTLRLDIQRPAAGDSHPLVIFVCGGGFWYAMKASGLALRTYVAESGFVVASIEYRTVADGARWSDAVSDVKEAVRFLRSQASSYGIDPTRVGLWGESAGGYLAAIAALTKGMQRFEVGANLDQSSAVAAVVDKFGPSNLAVVKADFDEESQGAFKGIEQVIAAFVYGAGTRLAISHDVEAVREADPSTYASVDSPPFFLLHGSNDRQVSPSQTLLLHEALRTAGADTCRWVLEGADHGDMPLLGPDANVHYWSTTTVMAAIVAFFARTLSLPVEQAGSSRG